MGREEITTNEQQLHTYNNTVSYWIFSFGGGGEPFPKHKIGCILRGKSIVLNFKIFQTLHIKL